MDLQEGLHQNSVNPILQTSDGYLWLGTFGGLARFDAVKFTVFNSANTPGMKANRILSLSALSISRPSIRRMNREPAGQKRQDLELGNGKKKRRYHDGNIQ